MVEKLSDKKDKMMIMKMVHQQSVIITYCFKNDNDAIHYYMTIRLLNLLYAYIKIIIVIIVIIFLLSILLLLLVAKMKDVINALQSQLELQPGCYGCVYF